MRFLAIIAKAKKKLARFVRYRYIQGMPLTHCHSLTQCSRLGCTSQALVSDGSDHYCSSCALSLFDLDVLPVTEEMVATALNSFAAWLDRMHELAEYEAERVAGRTVAA